jgi:hypothetical protein
MVMKVYISKYRYHWFSPYTWIDYMFFWTDWSKCSRNKSLQHALDAIDGKYKYVEHPEWVDKWADRLEPVARGIQWALDRIHPKINYVKIDRWDTWSMDHTLALIVLPMLRQLKADKHGAPNVDDEDVPEGLNLRSTEAPAKENEWDVDENHFRRWDWVLDEMIQAFECKNNDNWEEQYSTGVSDYQFVKEPHDKFGTVSRMVDGPNHTRKTDWEALKAHEARNKNGYRLFGKYYEALWD